MPKSVYLTAALLVALMSSIVLVKPATAQEYPGCFMVGQSGQVVDLNFFCQGKTVTPPQQLVFANLESQLILDDSMAQVRGTVTNPSSSVVPLKIIYFKLVADNRVLAESAIAVDKSDGLKPGESLSFDKVMSKSDLGNVLPSGVRVEVISYQ